MVFRFVVLRNGPVLLLEIHCNERLLCFKETQAGQMIGPHPKCGKTWRPRQESVKFLPKGKVILILFFFTVSNEG